MAALFIRFGLSINFFCSSSRVSTTLANDSRPLRRSVRAPTGLSPFTTVLWTRSDTLLGLQPCNVSQLTLFGFGQVLHFSEAPSSHRRPWRRRAGERRAGDAIDARRHWPRRRPPSRRTWSGRWRTGRACTSSPTPTPSDSRRSCGRSSPKSLRAGASTTRANKTI